VPRYEHATIKYGRGAATSSKDALRHRRSRASAERDGVRRADGVRVDGVGVRPDGVGGRADGVGVRPDGVGVARGDRVRGEWGVGWTCTGDAGLTHTAGEGAGSIGGRRSHRLPLRLPALASTSARQPCSNELPSAPPLPLLESNEQSELPRLPPSATALSSHAGWTAFTSHVG